jgi:hypothetical protein
MSADEPYEVAPRVWFGSARNTWNPDVIGRFTHVVNCDSSKDSTGPRGQLKNFLFLESFDEPTFPILKRHYGSMRAFIDDALREPTASVYIHCFAGINRSGALAVAYACDILNLPAVKVVHHVRRGTNRLILTNDGFMVQLVERFS